MNNEETVWVELTEDAVTAIAKWRPPDIYMGMYQTDIPYRHDVGEACIKALEGPRMIALPAEPVEQYAASMRGTYIPGSLDAKLDRAVLAAVPEPKPEVRPLEVGDEVDRYRWISSDPLVPADTYEIKLFHAPHRVVDSAGDQVVVYQGDAGAGFLIATRYRELFRVGESKPCWPPAAT